MRYFLYILKGVFHERFYTGSSNNPTARLIAHNSFEKGYTARFRPWKIVFAKEYKTKKEAQEAERKIKSMKSRTYILKIISGEIKL